MKKINLLSLVVATAFFGFVSSSHASAATVDRCEGLVPDALIQAESVADMYFDMRVAELQCHYIEKDQNVLNKIARSIGGFLNRYTPCIKSSQDAMVAELGGEHVFDNFYATLGNQIILLNVPDPCGHALKLSQALMKKPMTCGAEMAAVYQPWFEALDQGYIAKRHQPLHRICDKTDQ